MNATWEATSRHDTGAVPCRTDGHFLPNDHVFVGSASSDPVTTIVQQAQDPNQLVKVGLQAGWHFGTEVGPGPGPNVVVGAVGRAAVTQEIGKGLHADLGNDPAGQNFGAIRIHAETQSDDPYGFGNHSDYYARGSESLNNLARITVGSYDNVTVGDARPNHGDHYSGTDPESEHEPPKPAP